MNSNTSENTEPLPRLCPPRPGTPKLIYKAEPDDFIVEELPLYEPSGAGTHTWLWIEKRGLTTHAAARTLAQKLRKNPLDAGIAGLKDARAVTRQWITFENVKESAEAISALSDEKLRVLAVTRHANKLRMGHLRGNRFILRIKPADGGTPERDALLARTQEVFTALNQHGIPNYFGEQRFGSNRTNAAMGRFLVLGDTVGFQSAMIAAGQARQAHDRKLRNLIVNAFQSELFNRVLSARMPDLNTLRAGDLATLHRNGAVFKIADDTQARKEQPRADAHEISPSGPIFGPKMAASEGLPGEIETRILNDAGVTLADFGRKEAERQPGARRPLRVFFLDDPTALAEGDSEIILKFTLPSGSYATEVLNEI